MEFLLAYITANGLKAGAVTLAGMALPFALAYILKLFQGSSAYRSARTGCGKFSEGAGRAVSGLGNSKLKGLYEPLENIFVDFFLFMAEQFAVGLRKDNPDKMLAQAERLHDVGSKTRLDGIIDKMTEAVAEGEFKPEDPAVKKMLDLGKDLTDARLK